MVVQKVEHRLVMDVLVVLPLLLLLLEADPHDLLLEVNEYAA